MTIIKLTKKLSEIKQNKILNLNNLYNFLYQNTNKIITKL